MNQKQHLAGPKKKSFSLLIDLFFASTVWSLFFFFFPFKRLSQIVIPLLLAENFFLSYSSFLFFILVYPLPVVIFLVLFEKTPGNYTLSLGMRSEKNKALSLSKKVLYSYQSFYSFLLFFGVPELFFFLFGKKRTLGETVFSVTTIQKKPNQSFQPSWLRVFSIFLLLWALPTNLIFWKKISMSAQTSLTGFQFFKKENEWLEKKKTRNLKKKIRTPSAFRAFFEELRWSLIWQDMERHMHLLTPSSKLLVGLNLELYKRSLPHDIVFSHLEKTPRKNYFKLFYYRKDKGEKEKTPGFFYLTKKENHWKIDQSPLFLAHYLKL